MSSIPPVRAAACGIALVAACLAPPAYGQGRTAQAGSSAEIVGAVSTGAIFDIGSDLLTSIFVTGRAGDTVSLLAPAVNGLISTSQIAIRDDVTVISDGMVSINIQQIRRAARGDNRKSGIVMVLAQFN
jgi:hypothetical protein